MILPLAKAHRQIRRLQLHRWVELLEVCTLRPLHQEIAAARLYGDAYASTWVRAYFRERNVAFPVGNTKFFQPESLTANGLYAFSIERIFPGTAALATICLL